MFQSRVKYTSFEGQQDFDVPFPYLDRNHVVVQVNGESKDYIWLTNQRVRLTTPVPAGKTVLVARWTPVDQPLAIFQNSGTLDGEDLNTAFRQGMYRLQELGDTFNEVIPALLALKAGIPGTGEGSTGGTGGGGSSVVSWGSISGKPDCRALAFRDDVRPEHFTGTLPVSKGGTGANDAATARVNLGLVVGSNVQAFSQVLQAISSLSPSANKFIKFTGPNSATLVDASTLGGGGGGQLTMPNFATEFGGVGDGTTLNDQAFADAEASSYHRIWVPEGIYKTNRTMAQLTKAYEGPGLILLADNTALPARFRYWDKAPALHPVQGAQGWFRGDQSKVEGEYYVIGPGARSGINARYFESPFIPHHIWMDTHDGGSGLTTKLAQPISGGATNCIVTSTAGLTVGRPVRFSSGMDGTELHTGTVDWFDPNTKHVVFSPPAPQAMPAGTVLSHSKRTWNGVRYIRHRGYAEGDIYGDIVRMQQNYQPKAGQRHVFNTSTVGQYGGDVWFGPGSSGTMATGWESQYHDQGNAVAVFGQVDSFVRDNDTSDRGQVWLGTYLKSEGSKPADVAHVVAGKWRAGLDTVRADLTTWEAPGDMGNVAINTALGHRWVMNSSASQAARGGSEDWGLYYGNVKGDMYVESGNDGISDFIQMRFDRASPNNARFRLRPTSANFNVPVLCGSYGIFNGDLALGSAGYLAFGAGTGHYLRKIGNDLYWSDGSGLYKIALKGKDVP